MAKKANTKSNRKEYKGLGYYRDYEEKRKESNRALGSSPRQYGIW